MPKKSRQQTLLERNGYRFLEFRPETGSKEPYLKGTGRIRVSDVFYWVRTNKKSPKKFAAQWEVPVEAIHEALRWADEHYDVLRRGSETGLGGFLEMGKENGLLGASSCNSGEIATTSISGRKVTILLDESADEEELIQRLLKIGVNVVSPRQIGLKGEKKDERYLIIAAQNGWVLLTKNALDFRRLHDKWRWEGRKHAGILVVYGESDPVKDMKARDIAKAIQKLLEAGVPLENELHALNAWR